jgi:hypothetical protein
MCLTLFCFSKWKDSGNSKNATALRRYNADETLMFLGRSGASSSQRRGMRWVWSILHRRALLASAF